MLSKWGEKIDSVTKSPYGDRYLKPEKGAVEIRIVTDNVKMFFVHGFGANSTICHGMDNCDLCVTGDVPRRRFATIVFDWRDQKVKFFIFPKSVYDSIVEYIEDIDYGNPQKYNIKIIYEEEIIGDKARLIPKRIKPGKVFPLADDIKEKINSSLPLFDLETEFAAKV